MSTDNSTNTDPSTGEGSGQTEPDAAAQAGQQEGQKPGAFKSADERDWKASSRENEKLAAQAARERDELKAKLEAAETALQQASSATAERDELKAKLEAAETAKAKAEGEVARDRLRAQIARQAGVPGMADRLVGSTQEELEADAKRLLGQMSHPLSGTSTTSQNGTGTGGNRREELAGKISRLPR